MRPGPNIAHSSALGSYPYESNQKELLYNISLSLSLLEIPKYEFEISESASVPSQRKTGNLEGCVVRV